MKTNRFLAAAVLAALPLAAGAQTLLSNFDGPAVDSWTGTINGVTTYTNGTTTVTGADESGNGVLNISDGGFGGGAVRVYTGEPTTGFITYSVRAKIVTDPGNLAPNAGSILGSCFGLAAGNSGLGASDFAWSSSLSTSADDSGQSFAFYAASVRADGSGNVTAAFSPDIADWAVASGAWVVRLDNVTRVGAGSTSVLSDFAAGVGTWAATGAANSPWVAGSTSVSQVDESGNGVLEITDGGFTGGAVGTYASALPAAGVHVIRVRARIVTDPGTGSLVNARIAAAPGATTSFPALSWSETFATSADDSGQSFVEYAVPVVSAGPSDLAVYVLPDYDASTGAAGSWTIRIDDVVVDTGVSLPVELDGFSVD